MEKSLTRIRIELLILFAVYLIFLPKTYMELDMGYWREWALTIHRNGLANTYNSTINYFPIYIYGLYLYDLVQGTEANIIHNINNIKVLFVFFDFLPIVVLCAFRQKILSYKIPYLFLLLNIAYFFNSMMWGQIDSIYTNLAFMAIVCGIAYPVAGTLLYVLALNAKPQAIEFLPVIAVVLLYGFRSFKSVTIAVISAVALQLVILLPFISTGGPGKLVHIAGNVVGLYNNLSISAFNIWYLITRGNPYFIKDTDTYLLISYRATGLILFATATLAIMIPLLKRVWQLRKDKLSFDDNSYQLLFLGTGMLCLYFFYLNTQMHERYAHPIIIFFFFYGVVSKNYKLYILSSIPYFLSLDKSFSYPDGYLPIVHYKIIYASKILALWYTATVLYGSYLYYRLVKQINNP